MNDTQSTIARPDVVEDEHLTFLDALRNSGVTNMWGAGDYLEEHKDLNYKDAEIVLLYWMKSYSERQHNA